MREIIQGFTERTLEQVKAERVALSKEKLGEFLKANPMKSSVKNGEEKSYSVTSEKQGHLQGKIMIGTANPESQLTWNDTEEKCKQWTLEELIQLAVEMDAYLTPLVSHQQMLEILIRECETREDVGAVTIDYTEV